MRRLPLVLLVVVVLIGLLMGRGCLGRLEAELPEQVVRVLSRPETLELLSLEPRAASPAQPVHGATFYGFPVRGLESIDAAPDREQIAALVGRGVLDADVSPADCFLPRHGLRALREGRRVDVLISYECGLLEVHLDGRKVASVPTSAAHEPELSAVFRAHGLELADDR